MKSKTMQVFIDDKNTRVRVPATLDGILQHEDFNSSCVNNLEKAQRLIATTKAVRKLYGKNAFWWADNSFYGYGQVCVPIKNQHGSNNCITGRVFLEVI
jgi:surface antigen